MGESLGGNKSYMSIILELLNEETLKILQDATSSKIAASKSKYNYNSPDFDQGNIITRKNYLQHIAQLAESSIEYWIACGIHRATAVIVKEKKKKAQALLEDEAAKRRNRIGSGLLHGLAHNGKQIRKSILHFKDPAGNIYEKDDKCSVKTKATELEKQKAALVSKANETIADAKAQSKDYFNDMKAAKDARHKRIMQRRGASRQRKGSKKPENLKKQLSSISRKKTNTIKPMAKSPVVSDGVHKEFAREASIAKEIAIEAEHEFELKREAQRQHLQERLLKKNRKKERSIKNK